MNKDYKILQISNEEPRTWNNPAGGIVYYTKVKLEGHDRPVDIGKKAPNLLKVGDTVTGEILNRPEKGSDNFKASFNPSGAGGGYKTVAKFDSEGMAWGNSLNCATSVVTAQLPFTVAKGQEQEATMHIAEEVVKVASYFMNARPGSGSSTITPPAVQTKDDGFIDQPPAENYDEPF